MNDSEPGGSIADAVRDSAPAALGVLMRRGEQFAEAEDAVQNALLLAVETWPSHDGQ